MNTIGRTALRIIPESMLDTMLLRWFGRLKVPLLGYVKPKILEVNDERMAMLIPLNRRTKNHLNSMYFGALMIGADAAAGFYAAKLIYKHGHKIDFVFRAASGQFLKRPEGDVVFSCLQGSEIRELVKRAAQTGERVEANLKVTATVPSLSDQPVAEMNMVLSLKRRKDKGDKA